MRSPVRVAFVLAALAGLGAVPQRGTVLAQTPAQTPPQTLAQTLAQTPGRAARFITYAEARPIVERLAPEIAAAFAAAPPSQHESAWRAWVTRRDADTRARVARGDEDSLINLLRFGTSFTRLPRLPQDSGNDIASLDGPQPADSLLRGRIADLVTGIAAPGGNERLQFGRELVQRQGIEATTAAGQAEARAYILTLLRRAAGDLDVYARAIDAARSQGRGELAVRSTLYRDRGLSSDTSIRPDFAVDQALAALRARGLLEAGSVRRVAVIGPGLDFTDKAAGYDFYPQQTTQPFSVIDSLLTRGLAHADRLTLTTIDLSARVNSHLLAAQRSAARGNAYVLTLPRERGGNWTTGLLRFWQAAGGRIGVETRTVPAPSGVEVRAVRVRPEVIASLRVRDLDVVAERFDPLPDGERFDLVVATNILVYYDVVEQSLALANIASMLRPGGLLLSNDVLVELPTTPIRSIGHTDAIYSNRPDDRDQLVWYRRE